MARETVKNNAEAFPKQADITGPGFVTRKDGMLRHVERVIDSDLVRMPTASGDWAVTVPYNEDYEDLLFADVFHYYNDELLLAGQLRAVEHNHNESETTISGPDVTERLTQGYAITEYDDTLGHLTVQDYVDTHLDDIDIDWVVLEPSPERSVDDELMYDFLDEDVFGDHLTPRDDMPHRIGTNGGIVSERQSWVFWDQNATWTDIRTNPAASGGWGGDGNVAIMGTQSEVGDRLVAYFDTEYTIPADELKFRYRSATKGLEEAGDYFYPGYEWYFDDEKIRDMGSGFTSFERQFQWLQGPSVPFEVEPGTHKLELVITHEGNTTDHDDYGLDVVAAYDDRFSFTWDNDNGNMYTFYPNLSAFEPGYLDGPEIAPGDQWIELDSDLGDDFTLWSVALEGAPDGMGYQVSWDGGQTWSDPQWGGHVTFEPDESASTFKLRIQPQKAQATRTDATPKTGFHLPVIRTLRIYGTGEDVVVSDSVELKGDHLDNMQKLHDRAGLEFVLEYEGEHNVTGYTFRRGDSQVEVDHDWVVIKEKMAYNTDEYANVVTVVGDYDETGVRYEYTARSTDEIDELDGLEVHDTIVDSDLDTQMAVEAAAVNELRRRVAERHTTGSLTIVPESVPPGYSYWVEEWGDYYPLERIRYSLTQHDLEGTAEFSTERDVVGELSRMRSRLRDLQ